MDMEQLLDLIKIELKKTDYFTFLIPVTVFGFQDNMIMEVSVEYWCSTDRTHYLAHVWARQHRSHSKHFLMALSVPVSDQSAMEDISAELSIRAEFDYAMREYICEAAKHRCDSRRRTALRKW